MKFWIVLLAFVLACGNDKDVLRNVPPTDEQGTDEDGDSDSTDTDTPPDDDPQAGWYALGSSHPAAAGTRYTATPSGGVSNTSGGHSAAPSLAMSSDGRPYVAWEERDGEGTEVYLRYWNGSSWQALGTSTASGGLSQAGGYNTQPVVALDSDDAPLVVFRHNNMAGTEPSLYVRKWSGTSWVELAGSGSGRGITGASGEPYLPDLAVDASDRPIVAWQDERTGKMRVYVTVFDGGAWKGFASSHTDAISTDDATDVTLTLDANDRPIAAWVQTLPNSDTAIFVRRFSGSAWTHVAQGTSALDVSGAYARSPEVALLPSGELAVAWQSRQHANPWASGIAYATTSSGEFGAPDTSVTPNYERLGIAYQALSMALDAATPYLAFVDYLNTPDQGYEVYVLGESSDWVELSGSATEGGLSDSSSDSMEASIAIASDRLCVAWREGSDAGEIVLRCHAL